jgi:hypothetical protein
MLNLNNDEILLVSGTGCLSGTVAPTGSLFDIPSFPGGVSFLYCGPQCSGITTYCNGVKKEGANHWDYCSQNVTMTVLLPHCDSGEMCIWITGQVS